MSQKVNQRNVLKRHSSYKPNQRYQGDISGESPYQAKKDETSSDLDRLISSNCHIFSPNSSVKASEISMIHIKNEFSPQNDRVLQKFKKSHLEVLQSGHGHIPSPLQEQQSSFFDETSNKHNYLPAEILKTEGYENTSPMYEEDSDVDLERMEEEPLENVYEEFLQNKIAQIKIKKKQQLTGNQNIKKIKIEQKLTNNKTIILRQKQKSAGKETFEELKSSNKKIKVKLNNRYSNTGANPIKIENLYQVSGAMEERQEIQMDEPRLKIFRFKHLKTSLDDSTSKFGSNEKFVTIQQSDGKSSLERRAGSKKAASRYDKKNDESDSFERMSNIENEINNIFYDQTPNDASPKMESRELYHRSNEKAPDELEDILSNSQISRAHKFNIKRFSAVEEKKSKSPPPKSVMKQKQPSIIKLKANKKINYRKIEKLSEEKSPNKKKSVGKKSSCDMNELNPKNLYLVQKPNNLKSSNLKQTKSHVSQNSIVSTDIQKQLNKIQEEINNHLPPSKKKQLSITTSNSQKKLPGQSSIKKIPKFQSNLMNTKKSNEEVKLAKKPMDEFRSKSNMSPQTFAKKSVLTKTKSLQATDKNQIGNRKLTGSILCDKQIFASSSASGIPVSVAKQNFSKPTIGQKHQSISGGASPSGILPKYQRPSIPQNQASTYMSSSSATERNMLDVKKTAPPHKTMGSKNSSNTGLMSLRSGSREANNQPSSAESQSYRFHQQIQHTDSKSNRSNRSSKKKSVSSGNKAPSLKGDIEPQGLSNVANILYNTKEAILQQKISSKLENTKKIILKNQQQIINKQQKIMQQAFPNKQ